LALPNQQTYPKVLFQCFTKIFTELRAAQSGVRIITSADLAACPLMYASRRRRRRMKSTSVASREPRGLARREPPQANRPASGHDCYYETRH